MLQGEGVCRNTDEQLQFNPAVYAQVNAATRKAWRKLPSTGRKTEDLKLDKDLMNHSKNLFPDCYRQQAGS